MSGATQEKHHICRARFVTLWRWVCNKWPHMVQYPRDFFYSIYTAGFEAGHTLALIQIQDNMRQNKWPGMDKSG